MADHLSLLAGLALSALAPEDSLDPADAIIVTARRREEALKDVPIAVSVVRGEMLVERQIHAVKDIAAYTPGLTINSDSVGRAAVSIRGVGTTLIDTVQPGVGLFIDGIYQPATSYLNSPLVDVARVEVLRGPQGTLFGNNTLGGAINIVTRQPGNALEGRIDATRARGDDTRSLSASVSGPIVADRLQVRVGAAYHHQDGFQTNLLAGGDQNPLTQQSVNGTIRALPWDGATFTLNGAYDRVRGGSAAYLGVSGPTDYTQDGRTNQRSLATIRYTGLNGKGEIDLGAIDGTLTAVLAYNRRRQASATDGDYGPVDFIRTDGSSRLTTRTGEVRLDNRWSDSLSTLVGVFASRSILTQTTATRIVPFNRIAQALARTRNETQAIFGTAFLRIDPTIDVSLGLRYDHQRLRGSNAGTAAAYRANKLQPRATLAKRWAPEIMTYASVARGVRGGGQNGPGAPNPIYRGDDVWTYELGTKAATPDRRILVDAAIFYNDYNNFIGQNSLAPSTTGAGFVAVNLNTGHVTSYGAEVEAHLAPTPRWRIDGGLTLLHARITDDDAYFAITRTRVSSDRIIFTPDWNASLAARYTLPLGRDALAFDAGLVAKGSRLGSSLDPAVAPRLSPYYLVNGSVTLRIGARYDIAAFATNLFDERYIESYIDRSALVRAGLGAIAQNLAVQGARRRIGVRGTARF